MGEPEFINLYTDEFEYDSGESETNYNLNYNTANQNGTTYNQEEQTRHMRKTPLNDYKHKANHIQRGENNYNSVNYNNIHKVNDSMNIHTTRKKYMELNDEKLVWIGALFVFFGVFIFLVGYWLGKSIMLDLKSNNEPAIITAKQNVSTTTQNTVNTRPSIPEKNPIVLPKTEVNSEQYNETIKTPEIEITPPPIEHKHISVRTKTYKPQKTIKKTQQRTTSKGNYTIQVSANSKMESARKIETILRNKGFEAYIVETIVNGTRFYRVRVGGYNSKNDAKRALNKIKRLSIAQGSFIVNLN